MLKLQGSTAKWAALAVAVPTTLAIVYWLFLREDDDDADYSTTKVETSRQTVIRVQVPGKAVGAIIGQQGANIKRIQEESGARVNFMDREGDRDSQEDRTVIIRGSCVAAQTAELAVRQIVADIPVVITEEVEVPLYCLGRIIGRGGQSIREMCRISHCKILIDRSQDGKPSDQPRIVTITGSKQQIQIAKTLLEERVEEEEEFRAQAAGDAARRAAGDSRKGAATDREDVKRPATDVREKISLPSKVKDENFDQWDAGDSRPQIEGASPVKEFMEVFVSAVEHPGHFWLQVIDAESSRLDRLVDDMTAFYGQDKTQGYAVLELEEGQTVAAPFENDPSWYRARVLSLEEDKVDLYYFDFGDSSLISKHLVRELRPEYLKLPEQAVECKLAGIKPAGDEWSEEACDVFEDVTHCAQWKVLSARTVGYEDDPSSGKQRPCVQLVDNNAQEPTELAQVLVSRGLAAWDAPPTTPTAVPASPAATETVSQDLKPKSVPDPLDH